MPPAPQAIYLWRSVFAAHGVDIVNFSKLFEAGTWVTLRKGATLQEVGQPCNSVFLIVRGGADNYFEEKYTHILGDHTFICDNGLGAGIVIGTPMNGVTRCVTNQQTTCLVWRRQKLHELIEANPQVRMGVQAAISADVVRNLQ